MCATASFTNLHSSCRSVVTHSSLNAPTSNKQNTHSYLATKEHGPTRQHTKQTQQTPHAVQLWLPHSSYPRYDVWQQSTFLKCHSCLSCTKTRLCFFLLPCAASQSCCVCPRHTPLPGGWWGQALHHLKVALTKRALTSNCCQPSATDVTPQQLLQADQGSAQQPMNEVQPAS